MDLVEANITGVVTATTLKGNGDFVDIDVDGHAEFDDISVSGVTTSIGTFHIRPSSGALSPKISYNDSIANAMIWADDIEARFGGSSDFRIYHDTTGDLNILETHNDREIHIRELDGTNIAKFKPGGAVELYHNGQQKLITTINGIEVPDDLNVTGVGTVGRLDTNGVTLGTNNNTFAAKFIDDAVANFGTDNDLKISHDDTHARITNTKGNIVVSGIISAISDVKVGSAITMDPTSGIITATSFSGSGSGLTSIPSAQLSGALPALDGSALTGVTASGTGIIVRHDGSVVGTASSINFSTNLDVSAISAGIVTVTASGSSGVSLSGSTNNTVATVTGANALIGEANLTFDGSTLGIAAGSDDMKMQLSGSAPYIQFREGTTNKAYIQWSTSGYIQLANEEAGEVLRLADGESGLIWRVGTSNRTVWTSGNDGASSGLDADLLDGQEGSYYTNATNLGSGTIPNGRFPATLPAVSGANLTNLPVPTQITVADESSDTSCNVLFSTAATGDLAPKSGTNLTFNSANGTLTATTFSGSGASLTKHKLNLPAANLTGTLPAISGANLTNLPADTPTNSDIQVVYAVTANGSSAYRFAGNGVVSTADNPDLYLIRGQKYRFINNSGGSHPFQIRVSSGGSAYSTGVTNNGASSGNIDFAPTYDSPAQLVYQCTSHGGMVGNIYIRGGASVVTYESAKQLKLGDNTSTSVNSANLVNIDLGGTHHDTAGSTGKLRLWKDASDEMSLGVSGNQMDFILTSTSYSYNFYGGASGATRLMQLKQSGIELALGNETGSGVATPVSINLGGTYSSSAGNGNDLSAKLKVWCNGSDVMGLSVSGNQLDYIVTSENYDHVFYGGNAGTTELARFTGDGNIGINDASPSYPLNVIGDNAASNGIGMLKGIIGVQNNTTAFGSSPTAGISFQTKYRTSPDVPLDVAAIFGGKENTTNGDKDGYMGFATREEGGSGSQERMRITSGGQLLINKVTNDSTTHLLQLYAEGTASCNGRITTGGLGNNGDLAWSAGASNRDTAFGVFKNGTNNPGGYMRLDTEDDTTTYAWFDNSRVFRVSGAYQDIGTTNGTVVGTQGSDIRLKDLVGDGSVSYGLSEINQITPIKFKYQKRSKN